MAELVRTNDPAVLSVAEGLLAEADIPYQVTDRQMSTLWGSAGGIIPRVLVADEYEGMARQLLIDAGLDDWLRS